MNSACSATPTIPLPELSPTFAARETGSEVGLRPFGILESDLAVDFGDGNSASLVTKLLEQCLVDRDLSVPEDFFRGLSIGKRLQCLLHLAAGDEQAPFDLQFKCGACAAELEIELTLDDIAAIQRKADLSDVINVEVAGEPITLRKPTGDDQENWSRQAFRDEKHAATSMIDSLAGVDLRTKFRAKDLDAIDEAMNDADPLVNFRMQVACAECDAENEFSLDLCDLALGILARRQKQLVVTIHKLASRYHWSESEIFAIPDRRRREYLDLIATGR